MSRRVKHLTMHNSLLVGLFSLDGTKAIRLDGMPADANIVYVSPHWQHANETVFVVESSSFPEVPDGDPVPQFSLMCSEGPADSSHGLPPWPAIDKRRPIETNERRPIEVSVDGLKYGGYDTGIVSDGTLSYMKGYLPGVKVMLPWLGIGRYMTIKVVGEEVYYDALIVDVDGDRVRFKSSGAPRTTAIDPRKPLLFP